MEFVKIKICMLSHQLYCINPTITSHHYLEGDKKKKNLNNEN